MPIREGFDLRVTGTPAGLELWHDAAWLANAAAAGDYRFRGLLRGQYGLIELYLSHLSLIHI